MSRRPQTSQPAPRDYTSEIDFLNHALAALTPRWNGVTPTPPSLAEAMEESSALSWKVSYWQRLPLRFPV